MMLKMQNFNRKIYNDLVDLGSAERYLEELQDDLQEINLLKTFTLPEMQVLLPFLQCYAAPKGYDLYKETFAAHHLIIILSGTVTVTQRNASQASYGFGATLGEMALIEPTVWRNTCTTDKPTDLAVLSKDALNLVLLHHPRLGNKLLLALMHHMAVNYQQMTDANLFGSEVLMEV